MDIKVRFFRKIGGKYENLLLLRLKPFHWHTHMYMYNALNIFILFYCYYRRYIITL